MGAQAFVKFVGFVPDDDLSILYKEAEAFVFPTLSEGFGLPGLEAMSAGCPVVCSNIAVLKEVYGEAAIYFDPLSTEDMAKKITEVINDRDRREHLAEKGKKQVEKYSWSKMAREILKVYSSF
jgi:glycosyltransferase involved in cell wall biosynthesis